MRPMSLRFLMLLVPLRIGISLGGPFWSVNRIVLVVKAYKFLISIALKRPIATEVELEYLSKKFRLVLRSSVELALIREIFLDDEYKHETVQDAETIFDVGANIGMASIYFACIYPDAKIYAFEPDPQVFARLKDQVSSFENIIPMQMALGGTDGTRNFYIHPESILSGSLIERVGGQQQVTVPSRKISTLVEELELGNVDLLKFDIEGGERELFENEEDRKCVANLVGEVHLDILNCTKEEFEGLFPEFNTVYTRRINDRRYLFTGVKKV
ncbi:FkbM family methyltransferase [Patescibacteria group bacterium]|nr:FkbM family methyltransferase [Patescibacteria group bacterium]MBU1501122.1 FkbM family methyltransferase [Patescibacteria group bacterium]MBU2081005.1 FkbM family methyltransferase [Patescibacteria group bacterium]MBU2124097.1 FkbM family methyltransferase [Patescibacteria group bacterium]MBU2194952.1 FkbM family methyltransferase [Patescibacteria group bacterium]